MEYKKMAAIFGSIIFFAFVVFFVTVLWLAESRIFFTRDYIIYIKFDDVSGLKEQAPVYMRGFRIGRVKGVKFEPDCVVVRADINKRFLIPKGSVAEIVALNILGEKAIRIVPSKSNEYLENRAVIEGVNKDIMLEIKRFLSMLRQPIEERNLSRWLDRLEKILDDTKVIAESLKKQTEGLRLKENLDKMGRAGEQVSKLAEETRPQLRETLQRLQKQLDNLEKTLAEMQRAFSTTQKMLEEIRQGRGTVGKLYNDEKLAERLEKTLQELEFLIEDIRKNPKKYFKFSIF